jgi:hypothetical protein
LRCFFLLFALCLATSAAAQSFDPWTSPWGPGRRSAGEWFHSAAEPLPDGPLRWRGRDFGLAVGLQYFARLESRDNADFDSAKKDADTFVEHRARLSVRAHIGDRIGVLLEYQDVRIWGSERSTVTTDPFTGLHQGYLDLRGAPWFHLRAGRQEIAYGEDRLLGNLDWANSARAFDGVWMRFVPAASVTVDLFGAVVRERTILTSSTATVPNDGVELYGIYGRWRPAKQGGLDLYALGLVSDPSTLATGPRGKRGFATLGGRGFLGVGPFSIVAEGAYQLGSAFAPGDAATDHRAWAIATRGFFTAPVWGKPYVALEYSRASGDGNAADGEQNTFNQLFPTAHAHLGYIDYVGWQNVQSFRGTVGFRPWGAHVWLDVHRMNLVDPRGAWFDAAGRVFLAADPLRTSDGMGTEIDFSVTVPLHKHVAVAAAYAVFFPGEAAQTRGRDASHWGFLYLRSQL